MYDSFILLFALTSFHEEYGYLGERHEIVWNCGSDYNLKYFCIKIY